MTKIYTLTIFTSAFLLFLIQPMISKLLLPYLGGTPALWNTSMMFFETMLLLGYGYAHVSVKWLGAKKQAWLHLLLLAVAFAWLPIAAKTEIGFESVQHPISWIIVSLFLSVGIPFFVLAANAPLLQYWLSNTHHKDAENPYFLYSASNIGSLIALGSYPLFIEPVFTLSQQTHLWSALFVLFIILIIGCIIYLQQHYQPVRQITEQQAIKPALKEKLSWLALAFFPSSLLLGVTTYITTDIASLPLFWVIPLAIYLITFILAFAQPPRLVDWAINAQVVLVPLTVLALVSKISHTSLIMLLHLMTFFVLALGCHGRLARQKPHPKYLTEYYLWISFGGMLGGVFNTLLAPQLFTSLIEYPLILGLILLTRPILSNANSAREKTLDFIIPAIILALCMLAVSASGQAGSSSAVSFILHHEWILMLLAVALCTALTMFTAFIARRPVRFALSILALVLVAPLVNTEATLFYAERNFFGVNRLYHRINQNATELMHGTTVHGVQSLDPAKRLELTAYYSTLRDVFAHLSPSRKNDPVGAIGLGAGTVACLGQPHQPFDFYEIDPAVAAIASNPEFFTFLKDCPADSHIHLGDGRLEITKAPDASYGVIIVDAFSSDSIPVHLLTREALQIYISKLKDGGILAFNISNRHLNLAPLMNTMAQDAGLTALLKMDVHPTGDLTTPSVWVVMARNRQDFNGLEKADDGWNMLDQKTAMRVWTDDYSNILATLF